jgi:hypothetical protein
MTLTDFLLARYAEAEAQADDYLLMGQAGVPRPFIDAVGTRLQKECAAKRRIVEECQETLEIEGHGFPDGDSWLDEAHGLAGFTLRQLASVYADHPDYNQAWS